MGAVEAEEVVPRRERPELGVRRDGRVDGAPHPSREHHGPKAERAHGVVQLGHRFVGCVHRDHRHGQQARAIVGEHISVVPVDRTARGAAQVVMRHVRETDAEARVDDADIDAQLG